MSVIDVTEADWEREVITRSAAQPVVVDFWAEWCAPCRALGPVLEQAAAARAGRVTLAKLDTEANPALARQFAIQSIPAVKAFVSGEVVAEFLGAQPPTTVERFFDGLVPSEVDDLVVAGEEIDLRHALQLEPGRADAAVPLARLLLARGESSEIEALLEPVVGDFQADGLRARIALQRRGELLDAIEALDAGASERAFELLLAGLAGPAREDARKLLVGELDALGAGDPLARAVRRKLAAALY
ncbi:MAG: tetratricopeptide repeat protein [Solirubrobacteraceae bacterium]